MINQSIKSTNINDGLFFFFLDFSFLFFGPPSLSRVIFLYFYFYFFVASVNLWFSCWDQRPYWAAALWERFQLPIENPGWRGALVFWFVTKILKHKNSHNFTNKLYIYIYINSFTQAYIQFKWIPNCLWTSLSKKIEEFKYLLPFSNLIGIEYRL